MRFTQILRLGVEHILAMSSSHCLGLGLSLFPSPGSASCPWTARILFPLPSSCPPWHRPDEDSSYPALPPCTVPWCSVLGWLLKLISDPTSTCLLSGLSSLWLPVSCHFLLYYMLLENCATKYFSNAPSSALLFTLSLSLEGLCLPVKTLSFNNLRKMSQPQRNFCQILGLAIKN